MAEERVYNIPLRKDWLNQPRIRRVPRSVRTVRSFLEKHTKAEEVKLSTGVNEYLWLRGIKKASPRIKVKVSLKDGVAFARLPEEVVPKRDDKKKAKEKTEGNKDAPKDSKEVPKESKESKKEEKPAEKGEEASEKLTEEKLKEEAPKEEKQPKEAATEEKPKEAPKEEGKEIKK